MKILKESYDYDDAMCEKASGIVKSALISAGFDRVMADVYMDGGLTLDISATYGGEPLEINSYFHDDAPEYFYEDYEFEWPEDMFNAFVSAVKVIHRKFKQGGLRSIFSFFHYER